MDGSRYKTEIAVNDSYRKNRKLKNIRQLLAKTSNRVPLYERQAHCELQKQFYSKNTVKGHPKTIRVSIKNGFFEVPTKALPNCGYLRQVTQSYVKS